MVVLVLAIHLWENIIFKIRIVGELSTFTRPLHELPVQERQEDSQGEEDDGCWHPQDDENSEFITEMRFIIDDMIVHI